MRSSILSSALPFLLLGLSIATPLPEPDVVDTLVSSQNTAGLIEARQAPTPQLNVGLAENHAIGNDGKPSKSHIISYEFFCDQCTTKIEELVVKDKHKLGIPPDEKLKNHKMTWTRLASKEPTRNQQMTDEIIAEFQRIIFPKSKNPFSKSKSGAGKVVLNIAPELRTEKVFPPSASDQ